MSEPLQLRSTRSSNVLWILETSTGPGTRLSGGPGLSTPKIDNLARSGVRFDYAVPGAPCCCPYRASLLTGIYPHRTSVTRTPMALDQAIATLTGPLKESGYHTARLAKRIEEAGNSLTLPDIAVEGVEGGRPIRQP